MFGLPMEIVGPVIGIGSIIFFVAGGVVMVRLLTSKISQRELESRGRDQAERDHLLEDVQVRLGELDQLKERIGELEERVDFTERALTAARRSDALPPVER